MASWEIWTADVHGEHPVVILSHAARVATKQDIVVRQCVTLRAGRAAEAHECILDEADGLDWPTLCKCELSYTIEKTKLTKRRGLVTPARRRQIAQRVVQGLAFAGL